MSIEESINLKNSLKLAQTIVLFSCYGLILLFTIDSFIFDEHLALSLWAIQITPLILFVPALKMNNLRAYQWLCFLILFYFIQAILDIFTPNKIIQGSLSTFLCILLFSCAVFFVSTGQKIKHAMDQEDTEK